MATQLTGKRLKVFNAVAAYKNGAKFKPLKAKLYPDGHKNTLSLHLRALVADGYLNRAMDGRFAIWKARG